MIGQRRRAESAVDHVKSAELLAELIAGVPAALLFASMFQRDEHGSRRIPVLLEQLKVRVADSEFDSHSGDRHLVFRIELEYGSGMTRMKWVIHRSLKDFANLHLKYKLHIGTQKYIQLRHPDPAHQLPKGAIFRICVESEAWKVTRMTRTKLAMKLRRISQVGTRES